MQFNFSKGGLALKSKQGDLIIENGISFDTLKLAGPGEFEVKGVSVTGTPINGGSLFRLVVEDIALIYPLRVEEKISEEALKEVGSGEVLVLERPKDSLLKEMIAQFSPSVVIIAGRGEDLKVNGEEKGPGQSYKLDRRSLVEGETHTIIFS